MTDLLAPLNKDKKELMTELLETVKTERLEDSFNKYLPSVINEEVSVRTKKAVINESVTSEHTGNRSLDGQTGSTNEEKVDASVVEIDELRKLAGLK
jgi:phage-related protein